MSRARARTAGVVALVLVGSALCVLLGLWQFSRHTDRAAEVAVITANLEAPAAPLSEVLPADELDPDDVWREVEVTGEWVAGSGVQLRNRPVQDANASHALALFRIAEDPSRVLVVDRGWWRQTDVVPDGALELPPGEETITVRLRAQESLDDRPNPAGEVFRVHPPAVVEQGDVTATDLGGTLITSAYGMAVSLPPDATASALGRLPEPDTSLRSHLSYALQWWFFAAAVPVAAVVIKRRADADDAAAAAAAEQPEPGREQGNRDRMPPRPRRRRPTMEDEEDAILDAAERAAGQPAPERQASEISSA